VRRKWAGGHISSSSGRRLTATGYWYVWTRPEAWKAGSIEPQGGWRSGSLHFHTVVMAPAGDGWKGLLAVTKPWDALARAAGPLSPQLVGGGPGAGSYRGGR
jgi:hypothetical protein